MNGIIGHDAADAGHGPDAEQREYLEMVKASADSLLTVINDILDFSKIEAGKLELDTASFDLGDVVATRSRPSRCARTRRGWSSATIGPGRPAAPAGRPAPAAADPRQPAGQRDQVHRPGRGVRRSDAGGEARQGGSAPEPRRGQARELQLHFVVRDTGMGIPKDKQRVVFEAFAQADGSMARKYEGTGLGLTISSRLVEMMRGGLGGERGRAGEHVPLHGAFSARGRLDGGAAVPARRAPRVSWSWTTTGPAARSWVSCWAMRPSPPRWRMAVRRRWRRRRAPRRRGTVRPPARRRGDAEDRRVRAGAFPPQRGSEGPRVMMLTTAGRCSAVRRRELPIAATSPSR